ncbi:unnamed protein product [Larinioides sclopetarius]|uniref:SEC14-like protein 2 n=1 Tax=Larinioides sclopetarius TaxID=280406 RepID=A0AAV2A4R4_9ARAC
MSTMDKITDEEKNVIDELRKRTINDLTPKLLEDDTLFYRFAKARDFNVAEAETMLRNHLTWRKEFQIDTILTDYEPPEVFIEYGASSFVCFDKEGCAVRILDWGRLDSKGLCSILTKMEAAKVWFYHIELDKVAVFQRGGNLRKPILSVIYDLDDLTYARAVNMKTPFYFTWSFALIKTVLPLSVLKKIGVYGKGGWKEQLLKDIDADVLPAYLGGNRTDPDGNPLCETFIRRGKPLPKIYQRQNAEKRLVLEPDAEKLSLMPFSKEEITFEVKKENSSIEWEFEIKKGDIYFSLIFREESSKNLEPVEIIPKQRIDTSFESEKGYFKCEKLGYYAIVFDNSNSWLQSKEVYYRVRVINSENDDLFKSR